MKVSYCTTCRNRGHHLKVTLPSNLYHAHPGDQFVVLDYGSEDHIGEWIRLHFRLELQLGLLLYARLDAVPSFHPAHAKNVAHRLAVGDVVCNLDADNCIGSEFSGWLRETFSQHEHAVTGGEQFATGGGFGRLALRREDFLRLGGYDERMTGWGYEDDDLALRARASGLQRIVTPPRLLHWLRHGDDQRCIVEGGKHQNRDANKRLSDAALASRQFEANAGRAWGGGTVQINFSDTLAL